MSCKLVIVHRVPRGTNCVELYVFLSRFFSPIKKLGVSLIYKSDHALFFVVFSLRLRFASRASGTNRARSVRSRARIANLKKNVPPPLPLPPPLFIHSRARSHWSRAFWKGASRRRFLGCETVISGHRFFIFDKKKEYTWIIRLFSSFRRAVTLPSVRKL